MSNFTSVDISSATDASFIASMDSTGGLQSFSSLPSTSLEVELSICSIHRDENNKTIGNQGKLTDSVSTNEWC
ncbi:hypothetical protein HanHA300_Chr17g0660131 [Helianthus annuus]|nr:hypothetical protein HanHA300_Chr17g0660131 [Helianthus annuus]KAJ0434298.1 hypothetical protein HanIR_Chr17g0879981 [Helianthus annuus]KAJ0448115.1 hypothetical protein HanHA89_Chr17g0713091 [Helianthus annuus]KAJ0632999.1 hypothetical protein HanLR1_Chr17g0671571 [Helianthus annuus]